MWILLFPLIQKILRNKNESVIHVLFRVSLPLKSIVTLEID